MQRLRVDTRRWTGLLLLTGLLLAATTPLRAQPNPVPSPDEKASSEKIKYWIFFADKPASDRTSKRDQPFIQPEARERRERRGQAVNPKHDRPVSTTYRSRLAAMNIQPVVRSRWFNAISAYLTPEQIRRVQQLSFVEGIRPVGRRIEQPNPRNHESPAAKSTNRTLAPLNFGPSHEQLAFMHGVTPLNRRFNGRGVTLGFLDTQFDFDHPSLHHIKTDNRLLGVRDFTSPLVDSTSISNDNHHGTSVASIAAGFDSGNLIGPAYGARVLAATTEYVPREVNQEEDFFVAGMEWLEAQGADVVNVSLGYTRFDEGEKSYTYGDIDGNTALPTRAADMAARRGVVVVASAGNEGCDSPEDCWYYIGSPADGDSVIAVGAARFDSTRASFSSFGPTADSRTKPDVAALGTGVVLALRNTRINYTTGSGTSFSSPLVAGVACQLLQADPSLTPMEVRELLRSTASRAEKPDNRLGWGIINAQAAITTALGIDSQDQVAQVATYPNPFREKAHVQIDLNQALETPVTLTLYSATGRQVATPFQGRLIPGRNQITVDGSNLASGVYFYRLLGEDIAVTGSMVHTH